MLTTRNISLSFLNKRAVEIINKKISSHMKRTLIKLKNYKSIQVEISTQSEIKSSEIETVYIKVIFIFIWVHPV